MSEKGQTSQLTQHAMLVAWGLYAQQIGLIEAMETIELSQKKREHSPNRKVLEFMVAMLAGLPHLQDISQSAHPLDQDEAVARAWAQESWADYSGVSRTLSSLSQNEAEALTGAIQQVSQPFIDQEILLAQRDQGYLIYDGDLTGRPVSNSSRTYPGTAYGYMGDQIQLGYQAALVSMHSPSYGRQWLVVQPHPGDKVACNQLQQMVYGAEQVTGVRPQRRLELVEQEVAQAEYDRQVSQAKWEAAQAKVEQTQLQRDAVWQQQQSWQDQVEELQIQYRQAGRLERPHSALSKARQKVQVYKNRLPRVDKSLVVAQKRTRRLQTKYHQALTTLNQRQTQFLKFKAENAENTNPLRIIFRLDAGFGTKENVAWLLEMGYEIYTKPFSHRIVEILQKQLPTEPDWQSVGKNAQMVAWENTALSRYPYPLNVALARYHTGDTVRYTAFLHYGTDPVTDDLPAWFQTYNDRQTIEAGIKEGKGVFQMHHLKVRSLPALFLQEQFAAFAANFVRWSALWLSQQPQPSLELTSDTLFGADTSVKHLVQVAAHTSAEVFWHDDGCLIVFSDASCYRGHTLLLTQPFFFQLPLPLFHVSSHFY